MAQWGVDIGGTTAKIGLVEQGCLLTECEVPTSGRSGSEILDAIAQGCRSLGKGTLAGVGAPGAVDVTSGMVLYGNNLGWENFPLAQQLSQRLSVPTFAANDASMAAYGEWRKGALRHFASGLVMTLGTGIGCGVVTGESIYSTALGAPEFGHTAIHPSGRTCTCGRKGCFEAYCSALGLFATAREELRDDPQLTEPFHGRQLFQAASQGHQGAIKVVNRWLDDLSVGVANAINAFRPQAVAFGGGLTKGGDWFLAPLAKRLERQVYGYGHCKPVDLLLCQLGYRAGMIGAALWAEHQR